MARKIVAFTFSAATDGRAYQLDKDQLFVGTAGLSCLVSFDPAATLAGLLLNAGPRFDILARGASGFSPPEISTPVSAGEVIYLSVASSGSLLLYFDDILS